MTLSELRPLLDYWRSSPPTHVLLKAFMGFDSPSDSRDDGDNPEADQYLSRCSADEFNEILKANGLPVE